jgi:hypothetical protein
MHSVNSTMCVIHRASINTTNKLNGKLARIGTKYKAFKNHRLGMNEKR